MSCQRVLSLPPSHTHTHTHTHTQTCCPKHRIIQVHCKIKINSNSYPRVEMQRNNFESNFTVFPRGPEALGAMSSSHKPFSSSISHVHLTQNKNYKDVPHKSW